MPYFPPASSGSGAPTDATYITQTANGTLSAEQALAALSTGIMKVTTTTGVISSLADPLPATNGGTGVSNAGTLTNATATTITGGGTIALGGFTLTVPATGSAALLAVANTFTAAQSMSLDDSVTNATSTLLTLDHSSSGTVAASFGTRLLFNLETTTTLSQNAAAIDVAWSTATHASRTSSIGFSTVNSAGALTNRLSIAGDGSIVAASAINGAANVTVQNSGSGSSIRVNSAGGGVGLQAESSSGVPLVALINAGATNTIQTVAKLQTRASGTAAAGIGGSIDMQLETSTTNDTDAAKLDWSWVVETHASRTGRVKLSVFDTATREGLRIEASGTAPMIGFLGASAAARQTGGENLTNNVTSGGTDGTIANYTDLTVYANDAAAIRNDIYQLARSEKQIRDALRLYGLLT